MTVDKQLKVRMSSAYRLIFAGTPDFAVPALDALQAAGHDIAAVFTQPDRPAGRGRKLSASPVKRRAQALSLPVYQPASLNELQSQTQIEKLAPQIMVVVAYGLLLPRAVLESPARGCLNIHASLLPRWRGAAPIARAIAQGDQTTGISIMQMDSGLDTGPVLLQKTLPIGVDDTSASLHDRLARLGGDAIVSALAALDALRAQPQDNAQASHAAKLSKAEAQLDWHKPAARLAREIRAFNPWPVSFTAFQAQSTQRQAFQNPVLRVWTAHVTEKTHQTQPGTLLLAEPAGLQVAAGQNTVLTVTRVQRAGGKPVSVADFLNAQALQAGLVLA